MNNTINSNVNFKAEFINRTTVKNAKRLKKIREVFKHQTEGFNGKMYGSTFHPLEEETPFMTLHLSTNKNKEMNKAILVQIIMKEKSLLPKV